MSPGDCIVPLFVRDIDRLPFDCWQRYEARYRLGPHEPDAYSEPAPLFSPFAELAAGLGLQGGNIKFACISACDADLIGLTEPLQLRRFDFLVALHQA